MPAIDFTVQAGNAFSVLQEFATKANAGNIVLEHMVVNFTKINSKTGDYISSISGITDTHQKLTAEVAKTSAGIEILNLKLQETPKAAAAAKKTMAASLKIADAKTARSVLESTFTPGTMNRDQVDAARSRISQITSAIERGSVTIKQFENAVAASTGAVAVGTLTEVEQKVLNIIKRITNAQEKAIVKTRDATAQQKISSANKSDGQGVIDNLYTKNVNQLDRLGMAGAARVRRQLEQLQQLFNKGLTLDGYNRALKALETGTIGTLTKIESEARHRLERINTELSRGGKGGMLSKIFGGGPPGDGPGGGGGLMGMGGGTSKVIGGLLLAQGVDQAAEAMKAAATNTADFQKQIALLRTLTQDTDESFSSWEKSILRVSSAVGKSKEEIAASGYDLLSNQITKGVADTEAALTKAARFATATNSSVNDSVNLLSSVINSFGLDVSHTDEILASLFTTIDLGRVVASDLANTMGRPAVAAKSLGLSMHELEAAMITISQTGLGVEQTNTLITNVLHKLLNPTEELQKHYNELGVGAGDMYVKQFGLVGVLEDLIKTTGGSSSEMAKFFNEIRGEQGITQLTTRIDVLKDALAKLQKNTTYGKAVTETSTVPGQRFYEEMQKYSNAWVGFKETALKAILDVTDTVGGLGEALKIGSYLTMGLGTAMTGLYAAHLFEKMTGEALGFASALRILGPLFATLLPFAAAVTVGAVIGQQVAILYDQYSEAEHSAEKLAARGAELAESQAATVMASNMKMANANEAELKKLQTAAMANISKTKLALTNLAESQKSTWKTVSDELKDSFELVAQALKRVIVKGEEAERKLVEGIANKKDRIRDTRSKAGDDLYDARIAVNRVRVSQGAPDQEGRIQKQRVGQLLAQAQKLGKSGNADNVNRADALLDKALGIAQERRTATTQMPIFDGNGEQAGTVEVMKYRDGEQMIHDLLVEKTKLINASTRAMERQVAVQSRQNEIDRGEAKKLQDRAARIVNFKLTNADGKLNYPSVEKAREARDADVEAYKKQVRATMENQNVTPEARIAVEKTFKAMADETERQFEAYKKITDEMMTTIQLQEKARLKGEETGKSFDAQIAKVRDLRKTMDEAAKDQERYNNAADASFKALEANASRGTLGTIGKVWENLTGPASTQTTDLQNKIPQPVQDLLKQSNDQRAKGDIPAAMKLFDQATEKLKEMGAAQETIIGKNGQNTTLGEFFKGIRVELNSLNEANERFKSAGITSDNQVAQAGKMVDMLSAFAGNYRDVSAAAERFATVSEEAYRRTNSQAEQMISTQATMLRQLNDMTNVANNIASVTAAARQGLNPSLGESSDERKMGPPAPGSEIKARYLGGFISHFAEGGFMHDFMSGRYARGSDRHPAMLAGGESVNNQRATSRFAAQIIAMNAGFEPSFAGGKRGESGNQYTVGDVHIHVKGGDSAAKTTREMGAAMKREIRRGSLNL